MARPGSGSIPGSTCTLLMMMMLMLMLLHPSEAQPSPGYYPSKMFRSMAFYEGYSTLWGPQHQTLSQDQKSLTLWMDRSSGSGFKSTRSYRNGYFGASIRVQPGYTAGVNTAFYVLINFCHANVSEMCSRISLKKLCFCVGFFARMNAAVEHGAVPGAPRRDRHGAAGDGAGGAVHAADERLREWLWRRQHRRPRDEVSFDPTAGFHHYAILWNPDQILFLVDDVPIRRYEKKVEGTFPEREMWAYGSIWDASDWATDGGRYRADYRYQPFVSRFADLKVGGCATAAPPACSPVPASPGGELSPQQGAAMAWAQRNSMVYYYCQDYSRDHTFYPEC